MGAKIGNCEISFIVKFFFFYHGIVKPLQDTIFYSDYKHKHVFP